MTNEQLFAVLRPIVMSVTGVPQCIMADQNGSSPAGEYATIRPRQTVVERGQANIYDKNIPGDTVESDVRAQVIATASVQFFRGRAQERAELLKQCNKRPDVSVALFQAKIGWLGTDAVNNLTALQSANWEQRAQINIRLMYEVNNIAQVNNILFASLSFENEDGEVIQTADIP